MPRPAEAATIHAHLACVCPLGLGSQALFDDAKDVLGLAIRHALFTLARCDTKFLALGLA
jgi:hypothetical protein